MPRSTGRTVRFMLPALAGLILLTATAARAADDTWRPGKYMTQAMGRVMGSVRKVTEKTKFGLDDGSTCFIAGYLAEGGEVGSAIPLKAGVSYAILGGGDDDVKDLDLYLKDSEGNIVARDVATDANPVVVFTPKEDGKYRIVMKLASCGAKASFCAYATLRDGGFDVPTDNLTTSYAKLIVLCTAISTKLDGASFLDTSGELCLVGTILNEGETLTQSGIHLGDESYAFCATADGRAEDIDLKLVNSDDEVIETDTAKDATPILLHSKSGVVRLKISDAKSSGATLTMAAILKVGK